LDNDIIILPLGYDALSKSENELREQTFEVWRHSVAYEVLLGVHGDSLDDWFRGETWRKRCVWR